MIKNIYFLHTVDNDSSNIWEVHKKLYTAVCRYLFTGQYQRFHFVCRIFWLLHTWKVNYLNHFLLLVPNEYYKCMASPSAKWFNHDLSIDRLTDFRILTWRVWSVNWEEKKTIWWGTEVWCQVLIIRRLRWLFLHRWKHTTDELWHH